MKIQWSLIAALIFALITAIFAVINVDPVQVNLLFGSVSIPLILLILGCTLLGGVIVGSFGIYRGYKMQKEMKILQAKLTQIQEATGYVFPIPAQESQDSDEEQTLEEQTIPSNEKPF